MRTTEMPSNDFEQDYPNAPGEQSPGVYTRNDQQPQELDMLWSGAKIYHKEERSPLIFFFAGFALAAILTSAVFLLINAQPRVDANGEPSALEQPIDTAEDVTTAKSEPEAPAAAPPAALSKPAPAASQQPRPQVKPAGTGFTSYTVQNGDTLERIARKVYGSGSPANVEKIQRANNMSSPDKLQIDQKLVIPAQN